MQKSLLGMSPFQRDVPDRERPPRSFTLRTYLLNLLYTTYRKLSMIVENPLKTRILSYNTASGGIHPLTPPLPKTTKNKIELFLRVIPTAVVIKKNKYNS